MNNKMITINIVDPPELLPGVSHLANPGICNTTTTTSATCMHMLPYDDDDKEDRLEKLPAAVVLLDYREMGEGEEVKARWNIWATPKGDEDDSGEEHAGLQWQVWPEPIRPVGDKPIGLHAIVFTALTSPSSSSSSSCMPVQSGIGKALAAEESNTLHCPVCYHFLQQ